MNYEYFKCKINVRPFKIQNKNKLVRFDKKKQKKLQIDNRKQKSVWTIH